MDYDKEKALTLDLQDELKSFRARFNQLPHAIYMDGNSLGLSCTDSIDCIQEALQDWKQSGIKLWGIKNGKYYHYPQLLGAKMSQLIGAHFDEVIALGSITTNIHQLLTTLYRPTPQRFKILVDALNFPTDIYAVKSILALKGLDPEDALVTIPSHDGKTLDTQTILDHLHQDVALVLLPAVLYRSAQILELDTITKEAHKNGILIGWDLAHGIGALPFDFQKTQPDFAVWCTYKYLNAGPGAVAGLYLNRRHFQKPAGLSGWFGNRPETQFAMNHHFDPSQNASGLLQGTPHILSLAGLEGSLKLFEEAGIKKLREKSIQMTEFLIELIDKHLIDLGYTVGSPRKSSQRGGHVALEHPEAYRISLALRDRGVVPDFREPNVIRLAPMALYNTFEDIQKVISILYDLTYAKQYLSYSNHRDTVI